MKQGATKLLASVLRDIVIWLLAQSRIHPCLQSIIHHRRLANGATRSALKGRQVSFAWPPHHAANHYVWNEPKKMCHQNRLRLQKLLYLGKYTTICGSHLFLRLIYIFLNLLRALFLIPHEGFTIIICFSINTLFTFYKHKYVISIYYY